VEMSCWPGTRASSICRAGGRRFGPIAAVPGLGPLARALIGTLVPRLARERPKALGLLEYTDSWAGAYLVRRGLFLPHELATIMDPALARDGLRRLKPLRRLGQSLVPDPGSTSGGFARLNRRIICATSCCATPTGRAWLMVSKSARRSSTWRCSNPWRRRFLPCNPERARPRSQARPRFRFPMKSSRGQRPALGAHARLDECSGGCADGPGRAPTAAGLVSRQWLRWVLAERQTRDRKRAPRDVSAYNAGFQETRPSVSIADYIV